MIGNTNNKKNRRTKYLTSLLFHALFINPKIKVKVNESLLCCVLYTLLHHHQFGCVVSLYITGCGDAATTMYFMGFYVYASLNGPIHHTFVHIRSFIHPNGSFGVFASSGVFGHWLGEGWIKVRRENGLKTSNPFTVTHLLRELSSVLCMPCSDTVTSSYFMSIFIPKNCILRNGNRIHFNQQV